MKTLYSHSPLARMLAGISLAASILGSAGSAAAVTCSFAFPTSAGFCTAGSSVAKVAHNRFVQNGQQTITLTLSIDWQGGTAGAIAYGIDANGTQLSVCGKEAADTDNRIGKFKSIPCSSLHGPGVPGTAFSTTVYNHAVNIASTFVIVI